MKMINYKLCPVCKSQLYVNDSVSATVCLSCNRYSFYDVNGSCCMIIWDESQKYNISLFTFLHNENITKCVLKLGFSGSFKMIDTENLELEKVINMLKTITVFQ